MKYFTKNGMQFITCSLGNWRGAIGGVSCQINGQEWGCNSADISFNQEESCAWASLKCWTRRRNQPEILFSICLSAATFMASQGRGDDHHGSHYSEGIWAPASCSTMMQGRRSRREASMPTKQWRWSEKYALILQHGRKSADMRVKDIAPLIIASLLRSLRLLIIVVDYHIARYELVMVSGFRNLLSFGAWNELNGRVYVCLQSLITLQWVEISTIQACLNG